jgi:hypothetical protein
LSIKTKEIPLKNKKRNTMNTLQNSNLKEAGNDGGHVLLTWLKAHLAIISEWFWFGISFLFFLLLGPFSAIVVLIGLKSLASEEMQQNMREPAKL